MVDPLHPLQLALFSRGEARVVVRASIWTEDGPKAEVPLVGASYEESRTPSSAETATVNYPASLFVDIGGSAEPDVVRAHSRILRMPGSRAIAAAIVFGAQE